MIFFSWLLLITPLIAAAQTGSTKLPPGTAPFILGVVDTIHSKVLHEKRVLNIYLPEGYDANDTVSYPVVYLLDGSADEDFIHVVGLYQFNNFSWINRVPKSIIVGIATVDRRRDLTFKSMTAEEQKRYPTSGHSDQFIRFLEHDLQPYIRQKYKGTGNKTIIGQSLGGLLAAEILLKNPALFDQYIIISPSLWWSDRELLNAPVKDLEQAHTGSTNVYIGVGKEGLTPGPHAGVMEVDANLLAEKIKAAGNKTVHVFLDYLPEENHATVMHQALFNALRLLNPVNK
jgi:predicted alpha/beta superfamily hydrolase